MSTTDKPAPEACPDDEFLGRLLQGRLAEEPMDAAARHLESCRSCLERLEALRQQETPADPRPSARSIESAVLRTVMDRLRDQRPVDRFDAEESGCTDADLLAPPVTPGSIGSLAGYDVLERVASGGMGVVYKGFDRSLNRVVAIKVLSRGLAASAEARARFLREARAAAAIAHEHVVAIHAVGEDRGLPYLVMQYVKGRSLQARIQEGPLALAEILRIGAQTAAGLAAAHAQGIVHRDIKPGNILLENSVERVKVTDFGLARVVDEPSATRFGTLAGTPEYMSPEQARGEPGDARSDLFSLGCVLYAMATGESPFASRSLLATLRRVCDETPVPVQQRNPALPGWFGSIVERLLVKDPAGRQASAEEMADVLRACLAEVQSDRVPPLPSPRAPNSLTRSVNRRWRLGIGSVLALGLLGLAVILPLARRSVDEPAVAFTIFRPDGRVAGHGTNLAQTVAAAASGDTIEIKATGIVRSTPLSLGDKALTLRAASGSHPVLVRKLGFGPLLATSAALTLEGLEFRPFDYDGDPVTAVTFGAFLDASQRPPLRASRAEVLIHARGPSVRITHCRLVGAVPDGGVSPVLLDNVPEVRIVNSEFYELSESAIRWRFRSDAPIPAHPPVLTISNCVALSRGLLTIEDKKAVPRRIELQRNTLISLMVLDAVGTCRFETRATGNVFNVFRRTSFRAESPRAEIEHVWRGGANLYRDPATFQRTNAQALAERREIERHLANVETNSLMTELRLARDIQAQGDSIRAIRATDFRLEPRVERQLTKVFPEPGAVGAELTSIGPGAAYAAFRRTSSTLPGSGLPAESSRQ